MTILIGYLAPVIYHLHMSHVTCHMSPYHHYMQFRCYESPRRFGDAAAGGLVTDYQKK